MVSLRDLRKSYASAAALDGVSLAVARGRIFGIVGRSGAGKSTLLRCVNLLERPDSGQVHLDGQDLLTLDRAALNTVRRRIGMVFQHFNLLARRSVADNVALPLELAGVPAAARSARVAELLSLVGLADRAGAYPAQLSGGQKQRVGIARALAGRPSLLLCDEATSALDPETTTEILLLIRDLRDRLSLTVLLITHEMAVVKAICDEVAVLERGRVIEQGRVFDVFTRPQHPTTANFVAEVIGTTLPDGALGRLPAPQPGTQRRILRILFAGPHASRAVISEASREFGIDLNIIAGRVDAIGGAPFGVLAVAADGPPGRLMQATAWMRGLGLAIDAIDAIAAEPAALAA
uniref:methionine ABC transporter ATP-binding protein n=1 Tax=Limobrevibacterium gyesilva TaxID=2991712 RepID=UPI0038D251AE